MATGTQSRSGNRNNRIGNDTARGVREAAESIDVDDLELGEGVDAGKVKSFIRTREAARKIKLHTPTDKATSLDDAVVKRVNGEPDMRFAEDQNMFKRDKSKRVDGNPDGRFVENRPDILKVHAERGDARPNLIFNDEGWEG